jgi:hypothetical protein
LNLCLRSRLRSIAHRQIAVWFDEYITLGLIRVPIDFGLHLDCRRRHKRSVLRLAKRLGNSRGNQRYPEGLEDKAQVAPKRCSAHVAHIDTFFQGLNTGKVEPVEFAWMHLLQNFLFASERNRSRPGDSGPELQAQLFGILEELRPRPHKAHITAENVIELR